MVAGYIFVLKSFFDQVYLVYFLCGLWYGVFCFRILFMVEFIV